MSDDDPGLEGCPICDDKQCQHHLLACFDKSGDEGEFGVGLLAGALNDAQEIEQVLERARLAWVQSFRATGKPKAPPWIMKESGLRRYFDALGGIDVDKYDSDEDAASDLAAGEQAREDFLWDTLCSYGWLLERTEKERVPRCHHLSVLVGAQTERDRRKVQSKTTKHAVRSQ